VSSPRATASPRHLLPLVALIAWCAAPPRKPIEAIHRDCRTDADCALGTRCLRTEASMFVGGYAISCEYRCSSDEDCPRGLICPTGIFDAPPICLDPRSIYADSDGGR